MTVVEAISRDTLGLMHNVVARDEYRRLLELMLKSQRSTELTLKERIDYLQMQLQTENKRNAALGLMQRDTVRKSQLMGNRSLDDKLEDLKKVYQIKIKTLDRENDRLRERLAQIEDELEAVDIQEMKENESADFGPGYKLPSHKSYSDVNSLIESISMDGLQSIVVDESDEF